MSTSAMTTLQFKQQNVMQKYTYNGIQKMGYDVVRHRDEKFVSVFRKDQEEEMFEGKPSKRSLYTKIIEAMESYKNTQKAYPQQVIFFRYDTKLDDELLKEIDEIEAAINKIHNNQIKMAFMGITSKLKTLNLNKELILNQFYMGFHPTVNIFEITNTTGLKLVEIKAIYLKLCSRYDKPEICRRDHYTVKTIKNLCLREQKKKRKNEQFK